LFDTLAGPRATGATQNDVAYDISLAKTLTAPDTPILFTLFVETFAQTNIDGATAGQTVVEITPGCRFNLGGTPGLRVTNNWIVFGVDIPVAGPKPYDAIFRLTYITNF
jgi:hypothetical protein